MPKVMWVQPRIELTLEISDEEYEEFYDMPMREFESKVTGKYLPILLQTNRFRDTLEGPFLEQD